MKLLNKKIIIKKKEGSIMKRVSMIMAAMMATVLIASSACFAQSSSKTYVLSATVPAATGISIIANKVIGEDWTLVPGTDLAFGNLVYDPDYQIWVANHYFAIDVAGSGGAGNPTTTFTYTNGSNPNAPGSPANGLGYKTGATFVKATTQGEVGIYEKRVLQRVAGLSVGPEQLTGGWLRAYIGILDGDPETMPFDGQAFTNADQPGIYSGTLLVSATMQ